MQSLQGIQLTMMIDCAPIPDTVVRTPQHSRVTTEMPTEDLKSGHLYEELHKQVRAEIAFMLDRHGWNQKRLAKAMEVPQSTVSKFLKPGYGMTLRTLLHIANSLGCRIDVRFVRDTVRDDEFTK